MVWSMPKQPSTETIAKISRIAKVAMYKPSDRTIRIIRVLWAVALAALLYLTSPLFELALPTEVLTYEAWIEYGLILLALPSLLLGLTGACLVKMGIMKKLQIAYGLILWSIGTFWILEEPRVSVPVPVPTENSVDFSDLISETPSPTKSESTYVDTGLILAIFGLIWMLAGATGKMIPESCRRYGEKVTKIRV